VGAWANEVDGDKVEEEVEEDSDIVTTE